MNTDQIEKTIVLNAPLDRVWSAISDAEQFGAWFGARFEGPFVAGQRVRGTIVPTGYDEEIAAAQREHEGTAFLCQVEAIEPKRHLSFRWNPRLETPMDLDDGPTTLVTFELDETDGGTRLRITESGFDQIPEAERAKVFAQNEGGWNAQAKLITAYVMRAA